MAEQAQGHALALIALAQTAEPRVVASQSKMMISASGATCGQLDGGQLGRQLLSEARALLSTGGGYGAILRRVGQQRGVLVQLDDASKVVVRSVALALSNGGRATILVQPDGLDIGRQMESDGLVEIDSQNWLYRETLEGHPPPRTGELSSH